MDWLLYIDLAVNEENLLCVNKTQHFTYSGTFRFWSCKLQPRLILVSLLIKATLKSRAYVLMWYKFLSVY